MHGYEDAGRRGEAQPAGPRSNAARSCTESASRPRTLRPSRLTISIAHAIAGAEATPASRTSRKTTGEGRGGARFAQPFP